MSDEDILDTARACFLEHGASCPTTLIAERVGLSQAALFKRFGTKQEMLLQALAPPVDLPWLPLLASGPDDRPVAEQLAEVAVAMILFFRERLPCIEVLHRSGIDPETVKRTVVTRGPIPTMAALRGWLSRARQRGLVRADLDEEAFVFAFAGGLHAHGFISRLSNGQLPLSDPADHARRLVRVLCEGVAP